MESASTTRSPDHASGELLREKASQVRKDLRELGDVAKVAAQEKVQELRRGATEYYEQGVAKAKELEEGLENQIRAHPIRSVLIAAGAGLLGWLLWPNDTAEPMGGPIAPAAEQSVQLPPPLRTGQIEILRRDSISAALRRHETSPATAHLITRALRDAGADMRQVRPGDRLELTFDADDRLLAVAYESNPWLRFEARAEGDDWTGVRAGRRQRGCVSA